jgi:hypothetical protein
MSSQPKATSDYTAVRCRETVDGRDRKPDRIQSAGVLNAPPIIITAGSFGGGA